MVKESELARAAKSQPAVEVGEGVFVARRLFALGKGQTDGLRYAGLRKRLLSFLPSPDDVSPRATMLYEGRKKGNGARRGRGEREPALRVRGCPARLLVALLLRSALLRTHAASYVTLRAEPTAQGGC